MRASLSFWLKCKATKSLYMSLSMSGGSSSRATSFPLNLLVAIRRFGGRPACAGRRSAGGFHDRTSTSASGATSERRRRRIRTLGWMFTTRCVAIHELAVRSRDSMQMSAHGHLCIVRRQTWYPIPRFVQEEPHGNYGARQQWHSPLPYRFRVLFQTLVMLYMRLCRQTYLWHVATVTPVRCAWLLHSKTMFFGARHKQYDSLASRIGTKRVQFGFCLTVSLACIIFKA